MNELRGICLSEMDVLDMRIRELMAAAGMACQAASSLGDSEYADLFGHMKHCLSNLRAEADDIRGALTQLAAAEKGAKVS